MHEIETDELRPIRPRRDRFFVAQISSGKSVLQVSSASQFRRVHAPRPTNPQPPLIDRSGSPARPSVHSKEKHMPFQPGQSGNPAGRPPGSRNKATMMAEQLIDSEAQALARAAVDLAKDGDVIALRLCMDRLLAPRRQRTVEFALPPLKTAADAVSALSAIAAAVGAGELTAGEAAELTAVVNAFVQTLNLAVVEAQIDEMKQQDGK
jgi:hypothetical protein